VISGGGVGTAPRLRLGDDVDDGDDVELALAVLALLTVEMELSEVML
jgi:hypothetical protein